MYCFTLPVFTCMFVSFWEHHHIHILRVKKLFNSPWKHQVFCRAQGLFINKLSFKLNMVQQFYPLMLNCLPDCTASCSDLFPGLEFWWKSENQFTQYNYKQIDLCTLLKILHKWRRILESKFNCRNLDWFGHFFCVYLLHKTLTLLLCLVATNNFPTPVYPSTNVLTKLGFKLRMTRMQTFWT